MYTNNNLKLHFEKFLCADPIGLFCVIGENVSEFFFRVAALAFEDAILKDLETGNSTVQIGDGNILSMCLHVITLEQRWINIEQILYSVNVL